MFRLREILCRMLAHRAVQPHILVSMRDNGNWGRHVEFATESEEDVVINCVAIFYGEGKKKGRISEKKEEISL